MTKADSHRTRQPHAAGPTLLVVTRFSPLSGTSGAGTYLFSILSYLDQQGVNITVCWSERPGPIYHCGWYIVPKDFARIATLLMPGAICIGRLRLFPWVILTPLRSRIRNRIKRLLLEIGVGSILPKASPEQAVSPIATAAPQPDPFAWDRPPDTMEREFFRQAISKIQPDTLLLNFCWMTPIIDDLAQPAKPFKITLCNDLRHIYSTLENGAIHRSESGSMSKEQEMQYLRSSDVVAAIREDDAEIFSNEYPQKEVLVVHPSFQPSPATRPPLPHRCLFVASDSFANHEGLQWFLSGAWPVIRTADPAAELHICGSICDKLAVNEPGVLLRGFVPSLQTVYDDASVVIVPLLRGSGVKIKLMEALAHGKACVTTPIGTEGMPLLESSVLVASTATRFAEHVVQFLSDDGFRQEFERRAQTTISKYFSPAACYGPLGEHIFKASS